MSVLGWIYYIWSNYLQADYFHWKGPENTLFTNTIRNVLVRGVPASLNYSVIQKIRAKGGLPHNNEG